MNIEEKAQNLELEIQAETKEIEIIDGIKGFERKIKFRIQLFQCEEGLAFMDKITMTNSSASLNPYLNDLFKLAIPLVIDESGAIKQRKVNFNIKEATTLFRSPLSIYKLAKEILEFNKDFMLDSAVFRGLIAIVDTILNIQTSESQIS